MQSIRHRGPNDKGIFGLAMLDLFIHDYLFLICRSRSSIISDCGQFEKFLKKFITGLK